MPHTRKISGLTTEGLPFEMVVTYEPDAESHAEPLSLAGWYKATDGDGVFLIERGTDGLFYDAEHEEREEGRQRADDLLPWVISESTEWGN